ncbi:basement membrane-specific heparan sulfate proteoglycan core protein-like [Hippoglossus hippoglossus]|uniref:basement membrane-specific heparan sulfate proteoglycan core protein-like n=1 Tax=Hippoglossus hippoglossus TaxID=8267 RepID=UPI00148B462C|nr:basement membrane-specific heparan sulfate proteoglycan core protein-like [Hippoglossus hippoglossus]
MREANVSEWYYEFKWNDKPLVPITSTNVLRIPELTPDRNGDYQCIAHHNSSEENKQSNRATLSVSAHKPRATVRASRTSIPVAGTLTLTCSVEESAGWSYDWFTRSPDHDETAIATNHVQNSISISHGGIYWCRGRRTNSDFFSEKSHVHHIEKTLSNRSFVMLQHNWTQIFSGETISVRCEIQGGGDTQWDYEWRTTSSHQPVTGTNTAPTHSEYRLGTASVFHSGEYWCKARADLYSSTEWSDAFQLRVTHLCCDRLSQSLRTNQSSDPTVHHDENQLQVYSSLLHGGRADEYRNVQHDVLTSIHARGFPTSHFIHMVPKTDIWTFQFSLKQSYRWKGASDQAPDQCTRM